MSPRDFRHSAAVTYALSFGPDFFRPEDRGEASRHLPSNRPTSVEQAVLQLSNETWRRLARDIFHCETEFLSIEAVLEKIDETNTCLNLDSPVEVAIDADGDFTILVYDRDEP